MYCEDLVRITRDVHAKRRQEARGRDSLPKDDVDSLVNELEYDQTTSGDGFPTVGGGHSSGNRVDRSGNFEGRTPEPTGVCSKSLWLESWFSTTD